VNLTSGSFGAVFVESHPNWNVCSGPPPFFVDPSLLVNRHKKKGLTPEQRHYIIDCLLRSLKRDEIGGNEIDDWLIVNPNVHLKLARKFDVSRITIYRIWKRALELFTNGIVNHTRLCPGSIRVVEILNILLMIL